SDPDIPPGPRRLTMLLGHRLGGRVSAIGFTREETPMVKLRVNGQEQSFDGDPSMPLLWYLRDELGLIGTKYGCGVALCGACTVHIEGAATRACITTVNDIAGRSVITIEGLDPNGNHPVQKAWRALNVPQCG